MTLLTLLLAGLAGLFALLSGRFTRDPLERVTVGLTLGLLALVYAPQLSHLLLSTLATSAILCCTLLISAVFAAGLYIAGRQSNPGTGARRQERVSATPANQRFTDGILLLAALRRPSVAALLFIAVAATALSLWISVRYSQFGWDGWTYHAAAMAWFHQRDAIVPVPWMSFVIGYPKNIEFLGLWAFRFDGHDRSIDMVNLLLHWLMLPFAYGLGRRLGLQPLWSLFAALLYFVTPVLIEQTWTGYVDQAFSDGVVMMLFLLFTWMQARGTQRTAWAILLGCVLGYLAQIKGTGLHLVVITSGFVVAHEWHAGRRNELVKHLAMVVTPTALLGAGWYLHTWWMMGNPVYPFEISLPGTDHVLFPGKFDFKDSMLTVLGEHVDLEAPWPLIYLRMLASTQFGLHFFALGLPALLIGLIKGNTPIRWLLALTVAYLLVAPFSFIGRYASMVTASAALALSYLIQEYVSSGRCARAIPALAVLTAGISFLPLLKNAAPRISGAFDAPLVSDFRQTDGFRRFHVISAEGGSQRIGIADLTPRADNPHWYFYFGPRWENSVDVFDAARPSSFDFAVCAQGGEGCQKIIETEAFERVLTERGVEVHRRVDR